MLLSLATNILFYCGEMHYCQANLSAYFVVKLDVQDLPKRMSRFHGRHFTDRAEHAMKAGSLDARTAFVSETVGVYDYTESVVIPDSFPSCRCLKSSHYF